MMIDDTENRIMQEIKNCKNSEDIIKEYGKNSHVARFTSIVHFLDRCKARNATPENSITFYDATTDSMYIKYPYIASI